jgi:hypothetical protein
MTTTRRLQQRYDHRLRDLVRGTGDVTIATDLGVPRSTARGWLGKAPKVVVSLDVTNLNASELQQEVLELRRRVQKLTALLRLALVLLRTSGFTLTCCCGSCDCPRVGSTPGDGCSPRVRWTISRPVRTRRPID